MKNKTLLSAGVLTKPFDFLFKRSYNPQTQLTTMSIGPKAKAPMVERDSEMQPDAMVGFLNELVFEKYAIRMSESTLRKVLPTWTP